MIIIIIIKIISYCNWVAINLRLLLRPPVSQTLPHTHNQIKSNANCLVAVIISAVPRLVAGGYRGGGGGGETAYSTQVECMHGVLCSMLD